MSSNLLEIDQFPVHSTNYHCNARIFLEVIVKNLQRVEHTSITA
jgi:hypothetical protein